MTDRLIDVWVTTGLVHAGTYEAGSKISPIVPSCSIEPGQARRGWRAVEAEQILTGRNATDDAFRDAAQIALTGAVAREHTTSRSSWRSAPSCAHLPPHETRTYEHDHNRWRRRHSSGSRRRAPQSDGCRYLSDRRESSRRRLRRSGGEHRAERANPPHHGRCRRARAWRAGHHHARQCTPAGACACHWKNGRPDRSAALAAVPKRRRAALRPARRNGRRRNQGRSERGGGADRGHVSA